VEYLHAPHFIYYEPEAIEKKGERNIRSGEESVGRELAPKSCGKMKRDYLIF